jgi:hypothetical protein
VVAGSNPAGVANTADGPISPLQQNVEPKVNHPAIYSESAARSLLQVVECAGRPACTRTLVGRLSSLPERIAEERGYFQVDGASMSS